MLDTPDPTNEKEYGEQLWEESVKAHKVLSDKLHASTTALAFGSLWYLQSLEEHLPLSESHYPVALQIAWYSAYLACVFGGSHLWIDMFRPLRAYNYAARARRAYLSEGREAALEIAKQADRGSFWTSLPARLHMLLVVTLFSAAGFYKAANFAI